MPDFSDEEGNRISGVYGALYKLKSMLSGKEDALFAFSFDRNNESELTPAVIYQSNRFKEILNNAGTPDILDVTKGASGSSELISYLDGELLKLSPTGKVSQTPQFNLGVSCTSDLSEVEAIFNEAHDFGTKSRDNYIGYFLMREGAKDSSSKKKETVGIALCYDESKAVYIPAENFISESYIGKKLEELSRDCALATFDIKDDYDLFEPFEISERTSGYSVEDTGYENEARCFDVLIGAYLCNPIKNDYSIEDISKEYLKIAFEKRGDVFGKASIREADAAKTADYACKAAYICKAAAPLLRKKLVKSEMENLFYNIEMPLSFILFSMEKEGIIAKRDELKSYSDKLAVRISELEKAIYEAAGCEFNINSPKQLGEVLFEKLKLPAEKKTKSGYSTAADVLEKLAPDNKIVADILEYRGLAKLKSTYADGLAAFIDSDGRIHTSFNQTITATGRISSTEPNLQNIPMRTEEGRLIRKVFVPKDGYVFADADYSQIELRILAHMSEDKGLIDAYHEGVDIHRITASKVFHVPFEEVTSLQRRNAKAVNFGIVYGISSFGLSQDLSISRSEAKDYMDKYFETYPGVKRYQESVIAKAKEDGTSVTLFGRKRPIPELKASNFNLRQFGERVAMNAPIQGTAADIMKIAMINVFFRLKREQLRSRLILQIHDELVIETAPDEKEKVTEILTKEMENAAALSVPMEVDCHIGSDWYESK
ncbi:MAG: DNA polymerase I [Butyrivibrio sp.]|nr:DNA polymerase I [Butyrivibrio sp.]